MSKTYVNKCEKLHQCFPPAETEEVGNPKAPATALPRIRELCATETLKDQGFRYFSYRYQAYLTAKTGTQNIHTADLRKLNYQANHHNATGKQCYRYI